MRVFQVLDARFFGNGPSLPLGFGDLDSEGTERGGAGGGGGSTGGGPCGAEESGRGIRMTLDALLSTTYSRSQIFLSRQLAQLHPELTMPMFSGRCLQML